MLEFMVVICKSQSQQKFPFSTISTNSKSCLYISGSSKTPLGAYTILYLSILKELKVSIKLSIIV